MLVGCSASSGAVTLVLLGFLAACGGGGGGGGASSGGGGGGGPGAFDTAEYRANYGLDRMRLLSAYEAGYNGNGQTIAVIDTGIDVDHPDLDGNLDPRSRDIVTNVPANLNDADGHGTAVAGVAAAERNGAGMHGVAFAANILAIRADALGPCFPNTTCGFDDEDVANALDYARSRGASVINLSMGGGSPSTAAFRAALQRAVNAGAIVVISAGNSGAANPLYPARYAADPAYLGQIIAVGATNSTDAIAAFSNRAGLTANEFVVAPGVGIVTTAIGGGTATVSGTSFSAPHAAGATAILRQRFPALTAAEIVEVLLNSTRDLGDAGTDAVYGRGLVDLRAALAPLGALRLERPGGGVPAAGTGLMLGQAFGDALREASAFRRVVVFDAYRRDFAFDMRPTVQAARFSDAAAFEALVLREDHSSTQRRWIGIGSAGASFAQPREDRRIVEPNERRTGPSTFWMQSDPERRVRAGAYYGATAGGPPAFLTPDAAVSSLALPQVRLLGGGDGATLGATLGERRVTAAWHRSDNDQAPASLSQLWLEGRVRGARYAFGFGLAREDHTLLGTQAGGAFGGFQSTHTQFVTAGTELPLARRVSAFAALTDAQSRPQSSAGMLSSWSTVHATAFVAGIRMQDVATKGDGLAFAIGQPLRVERAEVDAIVPVALAADGRVTTRRERIDALPSGRETVFELAYNRPVALGRWTSFLAVRDQPGHIAGAPVSGLAGMRVQLPF